MSIEKQIQELNSQLYPSGRVWRFATGGASGGGAKGNFIDGVDNDFVDGQNNVFVSVQSSTASLGNQVENASLGIWVRLAEDIYSLLNQILPDNDKFTEIDAANWERVYDIIPAEGATLEERKQTLRQRMSFPNGITERQHYSFIQEQLQAAGFDVYVHENRFPASLIDTQFGTMQFGVSNFGSSAPQAGAFETRIPEPGYTEICANFIDPVFDATMLDPQLGNSFGNFQFGVSNFSIDQVIDNENLLSGSFFIGGENYPDFADVPLVRRDEFRQLILKLKPAQLYSINYINYTS